MDEHFEINPLSMEKIEKNAEIFAMLLNMNKKSNNLRKVNGVTFLGRILEGVFVLKSCDFGERFVILHHVLKCLEVWFLIYD